MSSSILPLPRTDAGDPARPIKFLVGTTGCARDIRGTLGSANYSYFFAVKALAPALERFGTWELVHQPESRLPYLAARAEAEGYRPVHLSVNPPHDAYITPALPTILLPFWEFPDIPSRDFGHDTRANWLRICNATDLILAPCTFTAETLREVGVTRPIAMVPIPLAPAYFDLPDWDPAGCHEFTYRHESWGGPPSPAEIEAEIEAAAATHAPAHAPARRRGGPLMGPARFAYRGARAGYHRYVRRWLSHEAIEQIGRVKDVTKRAVLRRPKPASPDGPPRVPAAPLALEGLVYTSIFNASDNRKNQEDMISAFLLAFRDRPDATLVLKLNTCPPKEVIEFNVLRHYYLGLGIRHRCRVVFVADFLDQEGMLALLDATTYYVNTSRAEGACMPLQQAMAAGRPAIAPTHTSMADYMDGAVGFPIRGHAEPTFYPHDPERRLETYWNRMVWSDIRDQFLASAELVDARPDRYAAMAAAARRRVANYAGLPVVVDALGRALQSLPDAPLLARELAA